VDVATDLAIELVDLHGADALAEALVLGPDRGSIGYERPQRCGE